MATVGFHAMAFGEASATLGRNLSRCCPQCGCSAIQISPAFSRTHFPRGSST